MSLVRAAVFGNLAKALDDQVIQVAAALKRAVTRAGMDAQKELRDQARAAGFRDGGRALANAWRLDVYPRAGIGRRSLKPAAVVWSRMPQLVETFDRGAVVRARGSRYLAIPTPVNRTGRSRSEGGRAAVRVTPAQMIRAGQRGEAFVIPSKSNPRVRLWCLRTAAASGLRRRSRVRVFVADGAEVFTGARKGLAARRREILQQGFVPMFFLMREVRLRKRLSVDLVRARAGAMFARHAVAELGRLA